MRNKTKCGLRISNLCIWAKTYLRGRVRREELGLRRNKGFGGRSFSFLVSKLSRRKKEARVKSFKRFKV